VSEVLHHLAASPGVDCWALLLPCWVGSSCISQAKLDKLEYMCSEAPFQLHSLLVPHINH
jgi:hypothetical protein